ncbi:MAG: Ig-like domain repeat protein [Candidatus Acidiferrales bacterium]
MSTPGPLQRWLRDPVASAFLVFVFLLVFPKATSAQAGNEQPLITQAVDETKLTLLKGNTHPLARAEFDRGPAPGSLPMQRMLLVLGRSAAQEEAILALLEEQQEKSSPNFHKWLTPEEFGEQFGASEQDIQTVTSWLAGQGFQVAGVSKGRSVIEFSGTAAQVQQAFHTTVHSYMVNGEQHWANASDPEIPSALAPVVIGVDSLNNFLKKAAHHLVGSEPNLRKLNSGPATAKPMLTEECGADNEGEPIYCNLLGPYDFATIYNVLPLWNAATPIDGTGESIALIGRSNINPQDVTNFRNLFGLPANPPQIILDGPDPGVLGDDDETEADLDVEWSGAIAKGATIELVVSESTETTDGVDLSAEYAVDNNVAPIISESFGNCELAMGTAGNEFYNNLWEQAAAEGISVFVSAGDNGSAGCDEYEGSTPQPAEYGLEVNGIGSTPYNVSVGGTDFNDFFDESEYWNTTANNPTTQESAKGYIPETVWNDSCTNPIFAELGLSTSAAVNCNNSELSAYVLTIGGSGGVSNCTAPTGTTVASCSGGYAKPPWQIATGVPSDGKRDVPDVSLFASNGFLDTAYALCETDLPEGEGYCTSPINGSIVGIGGTSAASPTFAALLALVDQKMGAAQGNPNFILYKLATKQTASSCNSSTGPASTCVFNDVTNGTNAMPCAEGSENCAPGGLYGVLPGYSAGTGYDQATGLGSVNASNLVNDWNSVTFIASATTLTLNGGNTVNITHGSQISVGVSVSPTSPEPTGDVSLIAVQGTNTFGFDTLALSNGAASGTTNMLPGGSSYTVKAHYGGDDNYGGSNSNAVTVTVTPEASKTNLSVVTFNSTSGQVINSNATTFAYGSPYLLRADVTNSSGKDCLPSGSTTVTYACPTGTVAITDNGSALGTSAFGLNSQGYTEDQTIQLTGGSHALAGNYSGDNSYNASSGTDAVTVTPAATTTSITPPGKVTVGASFSLAVTTQAQSSGVVPTGTYRIYDGGKEISSTGPGGGTHISPDTVEISEEIPITLSAPSGSHTLTVQYSGDTNYAASTSPAVTADVVYPVAMSATATPNSIIYGSSVTITATVDTTNPVSNAALKPTGSFSFSGSSGPISNPITVNATQDSSGNWELVASMTFAPQQTETVYVTYSGDSNYAEYPNANASVTVIIPDFSVAAGSAPMVITAGQKGTTTLTITPATNYTSTVQLSCSSPVIPGATCSISPASVTLSNGTAATAKLTIATLAPSNTTGTTSAAMHRQPPMLIPPTRFEWWTLSTLMGFAAVSLLMFPGRRRSLHAAWGFGLACLLSFAMGCGGGSGPAGPYSTTTTISASSTKIAQGSSLTLTGTVQSTGPTSPTGDINFNFANCAYTTSEAVTNGAAQIQLMSGFLRPGTCAVTAQYTGDTNDLPSSSAVLNIAFTGNTQQQIMGQTSTDIHIIDVNVTIQ